MDDSEMRNLLPLPGIKQWILGHAANTVVITYYANPEPWVVSYTGYGNKFLPIYIYTFMSDINSTILQLKVLSVSSNWGYVLIESQTD